MNSRAFRSPPTIHFGPGSAAQVGPEAKRQGANKVLVVTDPVLQKAGVVEPVINSLNETGVTPVVFDGVDAEPTLAHVDEGLDILQQENCNLIVACGGGSPIDAAKAIAIRAVNEGQISDFMGIDKIAEPGLPVLALPTTAGT